MEDEKGSSSYSMGHSAQEKALPYVPDCYVFPPSQNLNPDHNVPTIDLENLTKGEKQRSEVINEIAKACSDMGFFQVTNHGISQSVLDEAISSAYEFFKLPAEQKVKLMSNDVHKPVRYGTSVKDGVDKIQFWRIFLKHYAHPLDKWIRLWPNNPPTYREKMGKYCTAVRKLAMELMEIILESLGIGSKYLGNKIEEGMQVMAVNCYPPCPNPSVTLGLPPHSDYSILTIVLQDSPGLQIVNGNEDSCWKMVPEVRGSLQVHVGDHLEVLSNGMYKSVVHRVVLNNEKTRISIASLHSLGMDEKMETAKELVDENHPKAYKESSFRDFLIFLTKNDLADGQRFIDTLKIKN